MLAHLLAQQVNDRIPQGLPEGTQCAHKTGDLLGLCCADVGIVFTPQTDFPALHHLQRSCRLQTAIRTCITLARTAAEEALQLTGISHAKSSGSGLKLPEPRAKLNQEAQLVYA